MIQKPWDKWWLQKTWTTQWIWWTKCKTNLVVQEPEVCPLEKVKLVACQQLTWALVPEHVYNLEQHNFSSNNQIRSPVWEEWATIHMEVPAVVIWDLLRWHNSKRWSAYQQLETKCLLLILGNLGENMRSSCNKSMKWVSMTRMPPWKF